MLWKGVVFEVMRICVWKMCEEWRMEEMGVGRVRGRCICMDEIWREKGNV